MFKILFIGDINGKIGRLTIKKLLPKLKKSLKPDLIIANAENAAHGKGITEVTIKELMSYGVDFFTNGDHAFDKDKNFDIYDSELPIIRPANFSATAPGKGFDVLEKNGFKILVINLIGRVFMKMDYDCPFREIDNILKKIDLTKSDLSAVIVDIHGEATSEKIALGHYLNSRVSAVLGTHTHVMTNDAKIMDQGTAYITDVGMTGFADGIIGVAKENIIKTFLSQVKYGHELPETGNSILNAVLISIDKKSKKAVAIKPIIEYTNIK